MDLLQKAGGAIRFVGKQVSEFQQGFKEATSFLDPVEDVVTQAMQAESKLPGSRAVEGAQILAEQAGVPSVLIPLLGVVSVGGGIRLNKIKPDADNVYRITKDQRSQLKDQLYEYMSGPGQGSTKGFGQIEVEGVPVKPKSRVGALTNVQQGSDFKFNLKSGTTAADKTRAVRDTPSSDLKKFERAQFNQQHTDATQLAKQDPLYRHAGATPYKEHKRALNSPYWNSKRAGNSSGGDSENIVTLFDPDFKAFKDKAEAYVRRSYPEYDVFMDDMGELAVENLATGKILGYLNEGQPFKAQLDSLLKK